MSYYDTVEGKQVLQLEDEITRLSANIYSAEYRWLCLLAQFDRLEGWCGNGIKSFAHWLNWKCGISLAAGREKVRVASKLGLLPLISKAMSDGRVFERRTPVRLKSNAPTNSSNCTSIKTPAFRIGMGVGRITMLSWAG